jgi:exonuclease SbcD
MSSSKDKTEVISLKELKNKAIDYLALGHIHSYKMEQLDSRGVYCYPGCLEGRGFDECVNTVLYFLILRITSL